MNKIRLFKIRPLGFGFGIFGLALAVFLVGCDKPDPQSTQPEQSVQTTQSTPPEQPTQPTSENTAVAEHGTLPKTAGSFSTAKKWLYEWVIRAVLHTAQSCLRHVRFD